MYKDIRLGHSYLNPMYRACPQWPAHPQNRVMFSTYYALQLVLASAHSLHRFVALLVVFQWGLLQAGILPQNHWLNYLRAHRPSHVDYQKVKIQGKRDRSPEERLDYRESLGLYPVRLFSVS